MGLLGSIGRALGGALTGFATGGPVGAIAGGVGGLLGGGGGGGGGGGAARNVAGMVQGARSAEDIRRANAMREQAARMAQEDYAARAPMRDMAMEGLMGPEAERRNLSSVFQDPSNPFSSPVVPENPGPPPASSPARGLVQGLIRRSKAVPRPTPNPAFAPIRQKVSNLVSATTRRSGTVRDMKPTRGPRASAKVSRP